MRYVRFRAWLDGLAHDSPDIEAIHFEEVRRHLSTDAAHVHGDVQQDMRSVFRIRGERRWCFLGVRFFHR